MEKYEIVRRFNSGKATNVTKLANKHESPRSSLQTILSNKDVVVHELLAGRNAEMKRKRNYNFDKVDEPYGNRLAVQGMKIPVSGEMVLLKALKFAHACGYANSEKLDINWENRCKARGSRLQKASLGGGICRLRWQNQRLTALLKEFQSEKHSIQMKRDFFIGVCLTRDKVFKNQKRVSDKFYKQKLFMTDSMTGEKLPSLVIGKSPQIF